MIKILLSGICCFSLLLTARAQLPSRDSALAEVTHQIKQNHFVQALQQLEELVRQFPADQELQVMKGRVLGWNRQYQESIFVLKPLADGIPANLDAAEALLHVYYWSEQFDSTVYYSNMYLVKQPASTTIRMIRAKSLEHMGRNRDAQADADSVLALDKENREAKELKKILSKKNYCQLSVSYLNTAAYRPDYNALHYAYVEFTRKQGGTTLMARTTVGHGASRWNLQYEADYYQAFGRAGYMYLTAGVAPATGLFPSFRSGGEYFFPAVKKLEGSLGFRSMHFPGNRVVLVTGQVAYSTGHFQYSYRPFYDIGSSLFSHAAGIQHIDEKKDQLIRLDLQYGNAPFLNLPNNGYNALKAFRAGIQYQKSYKSGFTIRPIVFYEYEQYQASKYRPKSNFQLIVSKKLGCR